MMVNQSNPRVKVPNLLNPGTDTNYSKSHELCPQTCLGGTNLMMVPAKGKVLSDVREKQ